MVVCAKTVLIGHHTSGVRREFYRDEEDLTKHRAKDPGEILRKHLLETGADEDLLKQITKKPVLKPKKLLKKLKMPKIQSPRL